MFESAPWGKRRRRSTEDNGSTIPDCRTIPGTPGDLRRGWVAEGVVVLPKGRDSKRIHR